MSEGTQMGVHMQGVTATKRGLVISGSVVGAFTVAGVLIGAGAWMTRVEANTAKTVDALNSQSALVNQRFIVNERDIGQLDRQIEQLASASADVLKAVNELGRMLVEQSTTARERFDAVQRRIDRLEQRSNQ